LPSLFTDRRGGVSRAPYDSLNLALHVGDMSDDVRRNRASLPITASAVQFMNQTHGDVVVTIDSYSEIDPSCDALITTTPGLALAVLVADCIPLLLSSPTVIAAVHVGRKGLVNGIAVKTINQMRALGATSIHAQLGASICGECYEVPADMAQEVSLIHPHAFSQTKTLTPALDLPRALIADLEKSDVSYEATMDCTVENDSYFSYRRESITGRFAGIIWI